MTPSLDQRRALGAWGEALAARHLGASGYAILARRWRCRHGEIDLVARQAGVLVIVEVRTRRGAGAAESVTPAKQRRLALLADCYLADCAERGQPWPGPYRIDVIAITLGRGGAVQEFHHLEAAVEQAAL